MTILSNYVTYFTICHVNGIYYLGIYATVFQTEVKAVQKAAFWINSQGFRNETITIHSDSQAFLAALESITVKSSLVQDCI
jgi:hypothetical protein